VGDCRQAGQGFEFLGYRFEVGRRWVRQKSLLALRERIRQKTSTTVSINSWYYAWKFAQEVNSHAQAG